MDFLKQLAWNNTRFTSQFLDFHQVCPLEEEDTTIAFDCSDDDTESVASSASIPSTSSTVSAASSNLSLSDLSLSKDKSLCVFCRENKKEVCFHPCGHLSCEECFQFWISIKTRQCLDPHDQIKRLIKLRLCARIFMSAKKSYKLRLNVACLIKQVKSKRIVHIPSTCACECACINIFPCFLLIYILSFIYMCYYTRLEKTTAILKQSINFV